MIKQENEFYCFVKDKIAVRSIIKLDNKVKNKKM